MITYLKLLKLIELRSQPKRVRYSGEIYRWNGKDYTSENSTESSLSQILCKELSPFDYVHSEVIEEVIDVDLTEEEKSYLAAVIKPFRENVLFIQKVATDQKYGGEYICISYEDTVLKSAQEICLDCFAKGTRYTDMRLNLEYSLGELGL